MDLTANKLKNRWSKMVHHYRPCKQKLSKKIRQGPIVYLRIIPSLLKLLAAAKKL